MEATKHILSEYGNMSSASVIFILDHMRKNSTYRRVLPPLVKALIGVYSLVSALASPLRLLFFAASPSDHASSATPTTSSVFSHFSYSFFHSDLHSSVSTISYFFPIFPHVLPSVYHVKLLREYLYFKIQFLHTHTYL